MYPLKQAPVLPCLAAADACAEGDEIGIGGWIISCSQVIWFGETWKYADAQAAWPCLQAQNAQAYIACFETIAPFALLKAAHQKLGHSHYSFALPTGSDNIATEAGTNSLFTTTWPLCLFLRQVAAWVHAHAVTLQVSHVAGTNNEWADQVSCNNLQRFHHRPDQRLRFHPSDFTTSDRRLTLHPPTAPWGPERLTAAQSME